MNCAELKRTFLDRAGLSPDLGSLSLLDTLYISKEYIPFDQFDGMVGWFSEHIMNCLREEVYANTKN